MSEPLRRDIGEPTEGEEPRGGIADPATVEGGTLPPTSEAEASPQQGDPAGYPHAPADTVPKTPAEEEPPS
jgi:hypothetical protein